MCVCVCVQYKKASELAPEFPLPWLGMGQLYMYHERASNRIDHALAQFNKVLARYPANADALRLKAILLSRKASAVAVSSWRLVSP